jgi:hypothetical protein
MKKAERFFHFDDAGGEGIQPQMVRELRKTQAELAGVPTEEEKALSRQLEEMIEDVNQTSSFHLFASEVAPSLFSVIQHENQGRPMLNESKNPLQGNRFASVGCFQ